MNKKYFGIVGVIILVILLIICITLNPNKEEKHELSNDPNVILKNAQEQSLSFQKSKEQKSFTEINIDTYFEYYNGSENKIVLVARPTCQYCQIAEPIISKVAYDYDLDINYLNTDNFQNDDAKRFMESNEKFNEGFGTPMLLIISNNKIIDIVDGLTDYAHYERLFKDNKFIK